MKDRPEVRYRRQKNQSEVLHERKDGRISSKTEVSSQDSHEQDECNSQRYAEEFNFPNSTPAAITKAYNATICAIELGFVNKSCSQFIDIKLVYSGGKCNQLKIIGQTFLSFFIPTFFLMYSIHSFPVQKPSAPLVHV